MTSEKGIRNGLLRQMDSNAPTDSTARILARDAARVKRMKWLTIITWSLVAVCYVVGRLVEHSLKSGNGSPGQAVLMTFLLAALALIPFAMVFTASYYIRSRNLTVSQIQTRLAGIEEQLRRISQDKPTAPGA